MPRKPSRLFETLVQFAQFLSARPDTSSGLEEALQRGWVDRNGNVTRDGYDLADALVSQQDTRSVRPPIT